MNNINEISLYNLRKRVNTPLAILITQANLAVFGNLALADDEVEFDESFLRIDNVDIERFSQADFIQPGEYMSSLYINERYVINTKVAVSTDEKNTSVVCVTKAMLDYVHFEEATLPESFLSERSQPGDCVDLETYLPGSSIGYDLSESRLNISVPQIYLAREARGATDPKYWDAGVNAAYSSYNITGFNSSSSGHQSINAYLSNGVNVGSWYLRHNGTVNWSSSNGTSTNTVSAYLQRAIPEIKGKAIIGKANSAGQLFDSLPIVGAQLINDPLMLPESQRGYAPQIRGVARTNARVTVAQNDQIIYETTVSPGEFLIDDLYPMGFGGYLDIVIHEADGTEQNLSVPYDSLTQLLRVGSHRYSLVVGQYQNDALLSSPALLEATYEKGLTNSITAYSGVRGNQDYFAVQGGAGIGTVLGAVSIGMTQSKTHLQKGHEDQTGQSFEVKYSKNLVSTGSNFSLGAYRFSTEGYLDYATAMAVRDDIERGQGVDDLLTSKNRFNLTASQQLYDSWGQVYFSGTLENYWNEDDYKNQFQLGYSNNVNSLSWGANISRNEDAQGQIQTSYALNLSLPIGQSYGRTPLNVRANYYSDGEGGGSQQVGVTQSVGERNQASYGIAATRDNANGDVALDANARYVGSAATVSANVSKGDDYNSQGFGLSGTILGHSGGVTLSPSSGTTLGLIEAKGAEGAIVSGHQGAVIDSNGYAVVANLNPYSENNVSISLENASIDVEMEQTSQRVVPYENAIVLLKFNSKLGIPLVINTKFDGDNLPFGAEVTDADGTVVGNVGQGSQIYARVSTYQGQLFVSWGRDDTNQCVVQYEINSNKSNGLKILQAKCQRVVA
ncbi:fimbria/pilus outer membrane usher protein [Vibrio lentus]